ncbi:lymphocyte cytosolic protein 2a isoform X2 [Genypterus blacodes]|uniref:lymphocyte cytosolic protein 2a isoform X2 n=1 Tax=Genypterus blacodes TaxID=154954 RepID=UPI003F774360
MNFEVPSKTEVMGWSPHHLADFLKRMNLSGSDKVVLKNSMSGSRFVNMSDNDLQKFPKLHAPMISRLCSDISKKEEKRGLFGKKLSQAPRYAEPDLPADAQGWDDDEFDDDDYESPKSSDGEGSVGDYESPTEDLDAANDNDYEPPPSEPAEDLAHKLCPTLPMGDSEYIDNRENHASSRGLPPAVCPRPQAAAMSTLSVEPSPPRRDPSPHFGARPSRKVLSEPPQIFREHKPRSDPRANPSPVRGPRPNMEDRPPVTHPWRSQPDTPDPPAFLKPPAPPPSSTSVSRSNSSARPPPIRSQTDTPDPPAFLKPPALPPSSTSVSRSNSSARPPPIRLDLRKETHDEVPRNNTFPLQNKSLPPRPGPSLRLSDSLPPSIPSPAALTHRLNPDIRSGRQPPPPNTTQTQDLDPRWYVGKVTRGQAESCLIQVHKDGAYLVRDSTRQQVGQPFTLMVYYQDKVYNIQIKQKNQQYLLGTGLKVHETFPTVHDIICHYSQSPLLLIDAKNRGSGQQNQCQLSVPAGYRQAGHNRS